MNAIANEKEIGLAELGAILDQEKKVDYAVPANRILTEFGPENVGTNMIFPETSIGDNRSLSMTDYAADQFHTRLAKGFKTYSDELRAKGMRETYERNINDLTVRDNRSFRVRTIKDGQYADQTVRAIVSDKFKPIDDDIIFGTAMPLINPDRFQGIGGNKTDIRTVAKFIERSASLSVQSGGRTREFHLGFILNNSEVGAGSASFSMFMSDSFCTNGCIFSKQVLANISYRHIGSRIDIRHGLIEGSTIDRTEIASIQKLIQDATMSAMSMKGQEKIRAAILDASQREVTRPIPDFLDDLGKATTLTKDEVKELPLYAYSDEPTQLGMQAAITALAQTKPYERRLELESIGGNVLLMPERRWNALAVA